MKVSVYNTKKEEVGTVLLPKEIFEVPINQDLVYQVVCSQMANRRQITAKAKNRAEVRGGGKKPWRQKGTGRARHGSIRSPLWKGGGVTFGPSTERVFCKKIPKQMKRKALFMALSSKAREKTLYVLEDIAAEELASLRSGPRTKVIAEILNKLFPEKDSVLMALPKKDDNLVKSIRNIANAKPVLARDLNALDIFSYKYLLLPKDSIRIIKETFSK